MLVHVSVVACRVWYCCCASPMYAIWRVICASRPWYVSLESSRHGMFITHHRAQQNAVFKSMSFLHCHSRHPHDINTLTYMMSACDPHIDRTALCHFSTQRWVMLAVCRVPRHIHHTTSIHTITSHTHIHPHDHPSA